MILIAISKPARGAFYDTMLVGVTDSIFQTSWRLTVLPRQNCFSYQNICMLLFPFRYSYRGFSFKRVNRVPPPKPHAENRFVVFMKYADGLTELVLFANQSTSQNECALEFHCRFYTLYH